MIATEYSGTNGKLFATKSPPAIPFDPIPQRSSSIDVNVIPAGGQQQRPLWAGTNHADRDRFSEDNSWKTAQDGLRNYGGGIKDTFLSFFSQIFSLDGLTLTLYTQTVNARHPTEK